MKVRKKSCRHCLFTKNALGDKQCVDERRSKVCFNAEKAPFKCHEHSDVVICAGLYARVPECAPNPEKISENGDRKNFHSNLTRAQMNAYQYEGV